MKYIKGKKREEKILFPESLDEYISEENPVRFIDAYVEYVENGENAENEGQEEKERGSEAETGRPPYDPADMKKLFIYGYLNNIRSSRKLEREAGRNVEIMWLIGKLKPDYKTIADYRKNNLTAIKRMCKRFMEICKKMELFGGELLAVDGSKFRAVNNKSRNYNEEKLQKAIKGIAGKIDEYIKEIAEEDNKQTAAEKPLTAAELTKKIAELKERGEKYKKYQEKLKESGESQISLTDAESRSMTTRQGTDVCYNVQSVVDEKHKLIVAMDVTNEGNDQWQLSRMAKAAKTELGVEEIAVVADNGYYNGAEVKECEEAKVKCYIPKANTSANKKLGLYGKEEFIYDSERDSYQCPGKAELTYRYTTIESGRETRYYTTSACKSCLLKAQCTRSKENRRITRWVNEEVLERMQERMKAEPEKYKKRKAMVEHPFGTMKRWMDQGYFLMKGLEKVRAEFSLSVLSYNIKRVITIMGVKQMILALT